MKLTFLGTGTSTGVPSLNCDCPVCMSTDPHDRRMRSSALLETDGQTLLIDCGPDFYHQMLAYHRFGQIEAALITHTHYDHLGGVDDLRPYCNHRKFPIYCQPNVAEDLRNRVPYCFVENPYPGVPTFNIHYVEPMEKFNIGPTEILPVPVMHGKLLIVGYIFNHRLGYITDAKTLPDETVAALMGVDTLIINALRIKGHHSHMNLSQALDVIKTINPCRAYLIHMSHDIGFHAEVSAQLPDNVSIAYDGLTIEI
ncbi:MAG: MBL fold metallo-hydrolase [Muribaculaceae bacterium]|nr:MBL fold metallo-hydrolase [Muribaculaceae bacterium]